MKLPSFSLRLGLLCAIASVGIAVSNSGCIATGIYVTHRIVSNKGHTVTAQINENADEIYSKLVAETKENDPETLKIIKNERARRKFEAKRTGAKGRKIWFEWHVKPITETTSELTVSASVGKQSKEEVVQLIEDQLTTFCDKNGYEWERLN